MKIIILLLLPLIGAAQMNNPGYDNKKYHFGFLLGANTSWFKVVHSERFVTTDSVNVVESSSDPGFNLGIIADKSLGRHFNLRFIPGLSFASKNLHYKLNNDADSTQVIESVYINFPLLLKFKSDRINNFRFYAVGGVKYSWDRGSNKEARNAKHIVKLDPHDIAVEGGVGLDLYFELFKFSPEVRFSYGMRNILVPDDELIFASVLERLFARNIVFALQFE